MGTTPVQAKPSFAATFAGALKPSFLQTSIATPKMGLEQPKTDTFTAAAPKTPAPATAERIAASQVFSFKNSSATPAFAGQPAAPAGFNKNLATADAIESKGDKGKGDGNEKGRK